jgi:hypothetical protein
LVNQTNNLTVFSKLMECRTPENKKYATEVHESSMDEWVLTQDPNGPCFLAEMNLDPDKDVVWGYEMPRAVVGWLERNGFRYADVHVYPARFLSDLVFGVKTNLLDFPYSVSEVSRTEMEMHANVYRRWMTENPVDVPEVHCRHMVVGQSRFDRSILYEGKFHKVEEYVQPNPDKFVRRHPDERKLYEPFVWEQCSIYRLFDSVDVVEGINSSSLFEAEMFGIKAIYHGPRWWDGYVPVWGHELFRIGNTPPNFFRRLFKVWWGYENRA